MAKWHSIIPDGPMHGGGGVGPAYKKQYKGPTLGISFQ